MTFEPTDEQKAILSAARETNDNLIIQALAGSGKTATLVLLANELKNKNILTLAFNKRIAEEMKTKLPLNCTSLTLNSLGHRAWGETIGKIRSVDPKKNYTILRGLIDRLPDVEKEEAWDKFADTLKIIAQGKATGYVPDDEFPSAKPLAGDDDFFATLDEEPTDLQKRLIRAATIQSINEARAGKLDFDDQIFMPTIFSALFPSYDVVLVDEAQDLSALNHAMLKKVVKDRRLIAVGDPCQAIYAFRGAYQNSMELLQHTFNMKVFILSISFRCPIEVVKEAQWRAPHMQWPAWAKEGKVTRVVKEWDPSFVPIGAAVICRNNAPLFHMALDFLRNGRYCKIIGNDITKGLVKILKSLGESDTPRDILLASIDKWLEAKLKKSRVPSTDIDKAECLKVFAHHGENLGEAVAYAEHIMMMEGPIQLMTGHKSKGLEFEDVFILNRGLLRIREDEPNNQDRNLLYVMQTRSLMNLTYIETDTFVDPEMEKEHGQETADQVS